MPGGFASFVNHLLRLRVRFRQNLGVALFGLRQLMFDLLRVEQTFGDPLAPLLQNFEDWLVGELSQDQSDDDEADDLGEKDLGIKTKSFRGLTDHVSHVAGGQDKVIHSKAARSAGLYCLTRNRA